VTFLSGAALAWVAALLSAGPAWGAGEEKLPAKKHLTFQVSVLPSDPFSEANRVDKKGSGPVAIPRGETFYLQIEGTPAPGWHTYPLTKRAPKQEESQLCTLSVEGGEFVRPLSPVQESPSQWKSYPTTNEILLEHDGPFTWRQEMYLLPNAPVGKALELSVKIHALVCEKKCIQEDYTLEVPPVQVADNPDKTELAGVSARLKDRPAGPEVVPLPPELSPTPSSPANTQGPQQGSSLAGLLLAAAGAALLMLVTPCVFPMIPITVSFFLKQSEKEHNALLTAGVYALTIVVVLSTAVVVLGGLVVALANDVWVNLGLGLVLVFFALSLFGMFELELPIMFAAGGLGLLVITLVRLVTHDWSAPWSERGPALLVDGLLAVMAGILWGLYQSGLVDRLSTFTSAREGQGAVGAFFMALTFTITSFTCTGPFLGPILVSAKELQITPTQLILAAVVYSSVFAAPFFLLALFPRLLRSLPRSGGWLNVVKVVMGFLELGAALKFLGNTDIGLFPGHPILFNYDTVLCAWVALSVACGLYLLGVFRLPHDTPLENLSVPRMLLACLFLGLALYMTPVLWRSKPLGIVGEGLVAFLPLDTAEPASGGGKSQGQHLRWERDYQTAWEQAVKEDKLIFIDFTGVNCTNCRDNENRVFTQARVREELEKYVRVQLYNDSVPKEGLSPAQAKAEAQRNLALQSATFGDASTPLYVIFRPAKDKPIEDGKFKGTTMGKLGGNIPNGQVTAFVEFLKAPIAGQVARAR
jgi:thiol:disulfide interchange protein DsbD